LNSKSRKYILKHKDGEMVYHEELLSKIHNQQAQKIARISFYAVVPSKFETLLEGYDPEKASN